MPQNEAKGRRSKTFLRRRAAFSERPRWSETAAYLRAIGLVEGGAEGSDEAGAAQHLDRADLNLLLRAARLQAEIERQRAQEKSQTRETEDAEAAAAVIADLMEVLGEQSRSFTAELTAKLDDTEHLFTQASDG